MLAVGVCVYTAWVDKTAVILSTPAKLALMSFFLFNFYIWWVLESKILRPLEAHITALYEETHSDSIERAKVDQHQDEFSKLTYLVQLCQDRRRQMEQATKVLKKQKEYLQTVLETIPDSIVTFDVSRKIQMVNATAEKTFGYPAHELVGKDINILSPPDSEECQRAVEQLASKPKNFRLTQNTAVKRKDGALVPMEIWVSRLDDNSHDIFLSVFRDISQRKNSEVERERYLRDLEISNHELDDFTYIVSHDLREPLRGLQNFSKFLLEDDADKLGPEGKRKLRTISDLTALLGKRLETLLYYSRLGRTALAVRETDLDSVVRDTLQSLSITLQEKNTTVLVDGKLPVTVCDHARIGEVFHNLISNAIKYSDQKKNKIIIGTITEHPRAPGKTVFYVRDHGIGIAEKHLKEIFKIFRRLHPGDAYGGGTGAGLAIAKRIITQHNGEIWAESKGEGLGTTFFFTIPQPEKA